MSSTCTAETTPSPSVPVHRRRRIISVAAHWAGGKFVDMVRSSRSGEVSGHGHRPTAGRAYQFESTDEFPIRSRPRRHASRSGWPWRPAAPPSPAPAALDDSRPCRRRQDEPARSRASVSRLTPGGHGVARAALAARSTAPRQLGSRGKAESGSGGKTGTGSRAKDGSGNRQEGRQPGRTTPTTGTRERRAPGPRANRRANPRAGRARRARPRPWPRSRTSGRRRRGAVPAVKRSGWCSSAVSARSAGTVPVSRSRGGSSSSMCGIMFPDPDMPGVDLVLPDFTYLRENADRVDAVILTHGHEDHTGGLAYLLRDFPVPVYGSELTLALARNRVDEAGMADRAQFIPVKDGERRRIGPCDVEFIPVTHSVPHASPPPSTPRRASSCTPATSRSISTRSTAAGPIWPGWVPWPPTRGSGCCWPTRPTPRSPGSRLGVDGRARRCGRCSSHVRTGASS